MLKRDLVIFNIAENAAMLSDFHEVKIGCVIAHKREIIAVGNNHEKSHPMQKKYNRKRKYLPCSFDHFLHAEMDAIIKAKNCDFTKISLYTFRKDRKGQIAMSRPCPACMAKIKELGIKKIFYTTRDGYCEEDLK